MKEILSILGLIWNVSRMLRNQESGTFFEKESGLLRGIFGIGDVKMENVEKGDGLCGRGVV